MYNGASLSLWSPNGTSATCHTDTATQLCNVFLQLDFCQLHLQGLSFPESCNTPANICYNTLIQFCPALETVDQFLNLFFLFFK